jgi:hypothetical protein
MTPNKAIEKAKAEKLAIVEAQRRRALAYAKVFGTPGKRDTAQQIVWDDIRKGSYATKSTMSVDDEGKVDPMKMAANEGRRSWAIEIEEFISQTLTV